jgi:putative SOS response-associated peptidase YedK
MCNLYSMTKSREAIRQITGAMRDTAGEFPQLPAVFPDASAPVIRTGEDGIRELCLMRWGFPPPPGLPETRLVTNVRNLRSSWWRRWLAPEQRCLVPATSFCEWTDSRPKVPHWFAISEERPLFFFAGIWRPWRGTRRHDSGEFHLYAILTCETNETTRPIHAKAMPVILLNEAERELWLAGSVEQAVALQRAVPAEALRIVARGESRDAGPEAGKPKS